MMKRAPVFASILLLTVVSLAQQLSSASNPQDRTVNPNDQTYTRPATQQPSSTTNPNDQTYTPPTTQQPTTSNPQDRTANAPYQNYTPPERAGSNWGGWGLLGLLGLGGLLGRSRRETATYTRDERTYGQQRRAG
jgi:MYXO-CTERM domain-containing protein